MRSILAFGGILLAFIGFHIGYHLAAWELLPLVDDTIGIVRQCTEVVKDAQAQVDWAKYEVERLTGKRLGKPKQEWDPL